MRKIALITGITGQVGSYMAELLLSKGYIVHGIIRRSSSFNTLRIDHLYKDPHSQESRLFLHFSDLLDQPSLFKVIEKAKPDEVYHFAAQSHVRVSFDIPSYTVESITAGTINLLEACRLVNPKIRFYNSASSEMFGATPPPQNEKTPFYPRSPYGCAKVYGYWQTVNYREAYNIFACNGITFNMESPRRGETFVTRKITRAAARIKEGLQSTLWLGNMDAKRDWGFVGDYCGAFWLMLQHDDPDDYVVATGKSHSVKSFVSKAFDFLGLDWTQFVEIDERYLRPSEVDHLQGDSSKIRSRLGWVPDTPFDRLVEMMVENDHLLAKKEKMLKES